MTRARKGHSKNAFLRLSGESYIFCHALSPGCYILRLVRFLQFMRLAVDVF